MGADSVAALMDAVQRQCEKDVGVGLCQYIDLCFYASSLPCLHPFWHAIPTSFYTCIYIYIAACGSKSEKLSKPLFHT